VWGSECLSLNCTSTNARWLNSRPHNSKAIQSAHAHLHKATYAPKISTALYVMVFMGADALLGQVGGG